MKCPACCTQWPYRSGMQCKCGYHFALNPKEPPNIADMALKKALDRFTRQNAPYFTYNQLFGMIFRMIYKKRRKTRIVGFIAFFIVVSIVVTIVAVNMKSGIPYLLVLLGLPLLFFLVRRPLTVLSSEVTSVIDTYQKLHPIKGLVDGTMLTPLSHQDAPKDLLQFAPEKIFIVEHDDMVDMLIMNRFHFDQKALIVSAQKYPPPAFEAMQQFIEKIPDIPIYILHDVSKTGYTLKNILLGDPSWDLGNKKVCDLGLHPKDVKHLKHPIWVDTGIKKTKGLKPTGSVIENMENGFSMPVDIVSSTALMGMISLAAATGFALLSEELLAEQQKNVMGQDHTFAGSFG